MIADITLKHSLTKKRTPFGVCFYKVFSAPRSPKRIDQAPETQESHSLYCKVNLLVITNKRIICSLFFKVSPYFDNKATLFCFLLIFFFTSIIIKERNIKTEGKEITDHEKYRFPEQQRLLF